ncbi:hypothetical protein BD410DRAFT_386557 [Rickenella mellea]|uniref:Uncharacterized protein n=1 Tax=Rickenella mellea TaxID=50990 RepID=A0A4Y7PXT1_9AGAM|nr:hypothetical protein BD410DRAFT_386557 [Rickenella mellea]
MSSTYKAPSSSASLNLSLAVPSPLSKASSEIRKFSKKKDKDKKRKRDLEESDGDESQRPRKFSPHPPSVVKEPHHHKPSKLNNTHKASNAPDWSLPPSHPLIPPRPPIPPPPVAGPSKAVEVTEDFSKQKAPPQVPVTTFYASIEPWIRGIREEDVGWLEYTADEDEPYLIPNLGRHYTEVWEEEDIALYGAVMDLHPPRSQGGAQTAKWDPSTMGEADLVTDKGNGPVTERLVSALLPAPQMAVWKNIKEAEDAFEVKQGAAGSGAAGGTSKEKGTVADFEERVRETARFHGLLEGEPDFSQTLDDSISTALRQAQRSLRHVIATNKARKARLAEIARDRLAYQEYVECRETVDANISAMYTKLQKKDGPKIGKKKKAAKADPLNGGSGGGANGNGNGGMNGTPVPVPPPLPNPASLGLGPDDDQKLVVPDALRGLVETRRKWVDMIGGAFEGQQEDSPGRIWGVPQTSVFNGVDEQVREELNFAFGPDRERDRERDRDRDRARMEGQQRTQLDGADEERGG